MYVQNFTSLVIGISKRTDQEFISLGSVITQQPNILWQMLADKFTST